MEKEVILGLPVAVATLDEIIAELPEHLQQGDKTLYLSINPQIALHANKHPEIVDLANKATYGIADGIGIVKASKQQGGKIKERVTGIDLMYRLLAFANERKESIFLYGSKPEVLNDTVKAIRREYPDVKIAGYIDGYTALSGEQVAAEINKVKPTFVFVALGFPRQEQWLAEYYESCDAKVFQDVGGSFDVISGHVKRAPDFFIKYRLEWLYRSLSSPKRLYRIAELPLFMFQAKKWHKANVKLK
ncbi:WecB/TagA/CpsF family glycosyltransferase [Vagococcus sp. PNs007]|uniref:WecB/TagA/CpsF family glycosyltransferase n=1 Tax=Vagococcus proximus TaxID=2991417 RepID=A0ABT5WZY3_9ENTE|nr:WecB/TagA/CpsF family glycosyltransferase [Vagococcus proximus]MDF0479325.1 WecB/TagA/CpsF family glycosyltransferase [Vagococcus proximus]